MYHFVINGGRSRTRCLSGVSDVRVGFKTLPTLRPENRQRVTARGAELRTPKLMCYHLTRPHTRDSNTRFTGPRRHDSPTTDSLHWPNLSLDHHVVVFRFQWDCGSQCVRPGESMGRNREDEFRRCEPEPKWFLDKPAGSAHSPFGSL